MSSRVAATSLGSYHLLELIGQGGAANVYRAVAPNGERVAVKLLSAEARLRDPAATARFVREAEALARIRHPNVLRLLDQGVDAERGPYLVTPLLPGRSLREVFAERALSPEAALLVLSPIANGLTAVHAASIVHRDLKPENVMVSDDAHITIVDFGLAYEGVQSRHTERGAVVGSAPYMSPEQIDGASLGVSSDIWSLGVLAYEIIAGRRPFHRPRASEEVSAILTGLYEPLDRVDRRVSDALANIVASCLHMDPAARPTAALVCARLSGEIDFCDRSEQALREKTYELLRDPARFSYEIVRLRCDKLADAAAVAIKTGDALGGIKMLDRALAYAPHNQRVLSLVESLTGAPSARPPPRSIEAVKAFDVGPTDPSVLTDGETRTTWTVRIASARLTDLAMVGAIAAPFGGQPLQETDGSVAVVLTEPRNGEAAGALAARCALTLRQRFRQGSVLLTACSSQDASAAEPTPKSVPPGLASSTDAVLVDARAASELDGRFDVRQMGEVHALWRERVSVEQTDLVPAHRTPFVGRSREVARLVELFDECTAEGVARAVLITAPAGMGKSRLCSEMVRAVRAKNRGARTWFARGDATSSHGAFGVAAQWVRSTVGLGARAAVDAASAGEEFLAAAAAARNGSAEGLAMEPAETVRESWQSWLAEQCAAQPVLLVVDDLQWADAPTLDVLHGALRALNERPWMLVAFARPDVYETFPMLRTQGEWQTLPLGPLSRKASSEWVRAVLGEGMDPRVVDQLTHQSDGNPFVLEELMRAAATSHTGEPSPAAIAMARGRIEALDPDARRVLRAASVFGRVFWLGGVQALLTAPRRAVRALEWLEALAAREIVEARDESSYTGESEWAFRDDLICAAAYSMLTDDDRALGHRLAGAWLERVGERRAVVLEPHYTRGGTPSRPPKIQG